MAGEGFTWGDLDQSQVWYSFGRMLVLGTNHDDSAGKLVLMLKDRVDELGLQDKVGVCLCRDGAQIENELNGAPGIPLLAVAVGSSIRLYSRVDGLFSLNIFGIQILASAEEARTIAIDEYMPVIVKACRDRQIPVFEYGKGRKSAEEVFVAMAAILQSLVS